MIHAAVVPDKRAVAGGDGYMRLVRDGANSEGESVASEQQLALLAQLKADGTLTGYTLIAQQPVRMLKPSNTGQIYAGFQSPLGVDPATYPLVGSIPLRDRSVTFADAIRRPMGAVLTHDMADSLGLKVGDHLTLIGDPGADAAPLEITGIAEDSPDRAGDRIYYSLDTAKKLSGRPQVVNLATATWNPGSPAAAKLGAGGWDVLLADEFGVGGNQTSAVFDFMLKGAGILGLIVGGIGVANTLQVALARRTLEIAMLKTMGYRRRDLLALFGVETALLGLLGGFIGMVLGLGLAAVLMNLFGNVGIFLISWSVDWRILVGGVMIGACTSVIFGLYTIVRASSVRPAVLLRSLPPRPGARTIVASGGLLLLLVALFTAVSSIVMGSPLEGAEIVGAAIAGLVGFTVLLGGTLFVLLRVPMPQLPMLRLARQNMKRRPLRAVFPLIALFMGVFSIGFSGGTILNVVNRVAARGIAIGGTNLLVYGKQADAPTISTQLARVGATGVQPRTHITLAGVEAHGAARPTGINYLEGRAQDDLSWDVQVTSGKWTGAADAALLPSESQAAPLSLKAGDTLTATLAGGKAVVLRVDGFYEIQKLQLVQLQLGPATGLLVSQETAAHLAGADAPITFVAALPESSLASSEADLGRSLPQTVIVSKSDVNNALQRRFASLLNFVFAVAGLALLAGTILIANGVGLALIERRREMGILKSVGYTAGRVLGSLVLESALLGLLAGVLGMIAVAAAMAIVNQLQPAAQLSLDPVLAVLMVGIAVTLALCITTLVGWRPTHVRPLEVLRGE